MELTKLCLYAHGKERIALEDVEAVIGDVSALELDRIADALASGALRELDHTLQRLNDAGTPPARIVATALRHFLTLHALRCEMEVGSGARAAIDAMRPPIYFKRRDAMARQLQAWPLGRIEQAIDRLHGAEMQARTGDRLAMAAVAQTLLHICAHAAAGRRGTRA
jgi:DNA polymerase-3 subunit delta